MKNFWEKIKDFFSKIWNGLTIAGRIIAGLILIGLVGLTVYAASDKNKDENGNNPEVAQVYEPSIGSPLPADTVEKPGEVGGASTTEPSVSQPEVERVAPSTGIDPNAPVKYSNTEFKFGAILPAGSMVEEEGSETKFMKAGTLQYKVSVNSGTDSLDTVESQLRNSPSISKISPTNFAGTDALKFSAQGYGEGLVFIRGNNIYYLFGNSQYFTTFQTI